MLTRPTADTGPLALRDTFSKWIYSDKHNSCRAHISETRKTTRSLRQQVNLLTAKIWPNQIGALI